MDQMTYLEIFSIYLRISRFHIGLEIDYSGPGRQIDFLFSVGIDRKEGSMIELVKKT